MLLSVLILLQAPPPQRLSWPVWAAAILAFIVGVGLLVYFFLRLKRSDKELTEEEWSLSRRGLIVDAPPVEAKPDPQPEPQSESTLEPQPVADQVEPQPEPEMIERAEPDYQPVHQEEKGETRALVSAPADERVEPVTAPVEEDRPERAVKPVQADLAEDGAREQRPTEMLASAPPEPVNESVAVEAYDDATPFDDEIWRELEPSGERISATVEAPPRETREVARVDQAAGREPFEPPRIEPIVRREEYERPLIEPIVPRESTAREMRSRAAPTPVLSKPPSAPPPAPDAGVTREPAPTPLTAERAAVPAQHAGSRRVSGSVLGLPAEPSDRPLIFGEAAASGREADINALTNYGKDTSADGGHGGTIALIVAVLLVAGAVLSYLYVPSVHSKVDEIVARVRNRNQDQAAPQAVEKPKAMIFISRNPQVTKNLVKVRGSVDNISDPPEAIEAPLFVEVSLQRNDGAPPDKRSVPVNPDHLAPQQRGIYEFEYDGKQYLGYTVTGLTSKGGEVKFVTPQQR